MKNHKKDGSRLNRYTYPQWISAFILCLCILLTGHFWPAVSALEGDIMPLANFTGVHTVTLTGPNGYSQTVDIQRYYQEGNSPITFELASQSFDDSDVDSVAATLAEEIKSQYQISVTMDYYADGNTQYLNISDVTSEQTTLIDGSGTAHWAIRFELHFSDQFSWRDTSFNNTVYVQVLGDEKELDPGEIPDTPGQNYTAIKRWFPADSPQTGLDWQRTEDTRYDNWEGLDYNSGYDNSGTVLWGKQVTEDRDLDAWNLFTQDPENYQAVEDYLNGKYRYLGAYTNWYYEYPAVQWAYDSSLSGVVEVDGIPEVRYAFKVVTNNTFRTDGNNELGVDGNQSVSFYLYFVIPPEGLEGVTDWIPGTTADGSAWIEQGKEEKEITEERDSTALAQWDSENPNTAAFAAWLNDEANGYTKLIVNTTESGWSSEPYNVTWKFDRETIDVANDLKYYYFKAETGTTVFYGVDGLFGGKSSKTPLKFYLYFSEEYVKDPDTYYNVYGWQVLDPNGGNCGEITKETVLPNEIYYAAPCYDIEYIHLAAETTFKNVDDLSSKAFKDEMEQYLADHFYKDGKISYTLKVGYNNNVNSWDVVPIKSITFDAEKTEKENNKEIGNAAENRNYDPNRVVAMFKLELVDNFYWDNDTGRPVQFYISVTEAALTRNPVTDEDVIASHVVNETNHPKNFGGPIIEQPKGVTVNLFDYWLDGTEDEPNGTGNLDSKPFYNWTPYNVKWEVGRSENVFQSGINIGHLFLFGGGNRFRGWQADAGNPNIVGNWNFYTGDPVATNGENSGKMLGKGGPNDGIVQNKLVGGYPALNLDNSKWGTFNARSAPWSYFGAGKEFNGSSWYVDNFGRATLYVKGPNDKSNEGGRSDFGTHFDPDNPNTYFTPVGENKLTESLSYLFDPTENTPYRTVYEDIRGMFRLDEAGYYYFNAPEDLFVAEENALSKGRTNVYAELDTEQKTDDDGKSYYEMTLYDEAYGTQFFPFDEWGKSFEYYEEYNEETEKLEAKVKPNRFEPDQYDATADEKLIQIDNYANNLNHFFGMTLDATFQQPLKGLVNGEHMVFQFSGDDDVWIFIDGVLVGDLGGVHSKSSVEIDYATGIIRIQDRRWNDLTEEEREALGLQLDDPWLQDTLYNMFDKAGAANKVDWVEAENGERIFATNTIHELKFFYLERGHEESNLSLTFNFPEVNPDRIQKVDEDGNSLSEDATFALYKAYVKNDDAEKTKSNTPIEAGDWSHTSDEFTYSESDLIVKDVTDTIGIGYAELGEETAMGAVPLVYGIYDTIFFVLEETETPHGYRSNKPIVLQYNKESATLTVVNKYETGAYSSYIAKWTGKVFTDENSTLSLMEYDLNSGTNRPFVESDKKLKRDDLASGLTVVIPIIKQTAENGSVQWYPLYGSNTYGWHTVDPGDTDHNTFVKALIRAAVMQVAVDATNVRDWYLTWNDYYQRLDGFMENLPGNATRYLNFNPEEGDMSLVPLYLPEDVLKQVIGDELGDAVDDDDRFALFKKALQDYLTDKLKKDIDDIKSEEDLENALVALTEYVENISDYLESHNLARANILDNGRESFNRQPSTVIFVPNEQRELRVRKIDPKGNYVNGVVFAIFTSPDAAAKFPGDTKYTSAEKAMEALEDAGIEKGVASYGQTANAKVNDTLTLQGTLIFKENGANRNHTNGIAHIDWPSSLADAGTDGALPSVLWLKEIYAPAGYVLNENLVRIEVGDRAIYANATGYDSDGEILQPKPGETSVKDGITVQAGLGKLAQTLVKYAIGNHTDVTLQDITIYEQTQDGAFDPDGWNTQSDNLFNLHYGMNAEELTGQYGRHNSTDALPIFVAEDGYIRVMPRQRALIRDEDHDANTHRDDLTGIDLDSLFSLLNVVIIENDLINASMEISKEVTVTGDAPENDIYQFEISFTPPQGVSANELAGIYEAYIHQTGHKLPLLDENGEQVVTDGVPQYSGPCAPADIEADGHTRLYLYVDEKGNAWVTTDPSSTQNLSRLTLEDDQTYVILGLPEGTGFTVKETITADPEAEYEYETSIGVEDYLTKDPNYTVTDADRSVSGVLNSADPDDPDADIPSVKVHYENIVTYSGPDIPVDPPDPDDDEVVLVDLGGPGTYVFTVPGMVLLLIGCLLLIKRKRQYD